MRLFDHTDRTDRGWIYYPGVLSELGRWFFHWSPFYRSGGKLHSLPLRDYAALLKSRFSAKPSSEWPTKPDNRFLHVPILSGRPRGIS